MFREFSKDALMAARAELDNIHGSYFETLCRAAHVLFKSKLDEAIGSENELKADYPNVADPSAQARSPRFVGGMTGPRTKN